MVERSAPGPTAHAVSINDASEAQLAELSDIGPQRAHKIVERRRERGRFASIDELVEIEGFGSRLPRELRDELTC